MPYALPPFPHKIQKGGANSNTNHKCLGSLGSNPKLALSSSYSYHNIFSNNTSHPWPSQPLLLPRCFPNNLSLALWVGFQPWILHSFGNLVKSWSEPMGLSILLGFFHDGVFLELLLLLLPVSVMQGEVVHRVRGLQGGITYHNQKVSISIRSHQMNHRIES